MTSGRLITCQQSWTCSQLRCAIKLFPSTFISSSTTLRGGGTKSLPWFHLKFFAVIVLPAARTFVMISRSMFCNPAVNWEVVWTMFIVVVRSRALKAEAASFTLGPLFHACQCRANWPQYFFITLHD